MFSPELKLTVNHFKGAAQHSNSIFSNEEMETGEGGGETQTVLQTEGGGGRVFTLEEVKRGKEIRKQRKGQPASQLGDCRRGTNWRERQTDGEISHSDQ
jgi:hypothetical protein